ncbi:MULTISPECIES: DUF4114 domain-containing protein [unclassified Tolypothrix]|uniref:DUF4114 domain-containing protein n=1 Tax=unclassified Tolypothrix TaxID=2649714 RepID=UPI0005EABF02|nr:MULTISPECIES: DUF4114 domain-containing protein [unclassified Tolypothrix]BAY89986.1 Na-Ca exchanger/integrin-beta4 [Microchaete diplosiphon NIES-3275]EKE98763.1 type I secretion target GGXGXDXXX repeat-containing domain protein [Tolypothrix sp. PCC 7601]MBE9084899.1 DUF4114 domain-containing protein [Tolypothrix sp. LEGE 11397]UYD24216.1 DUF4114 domain-containing protein [Tolypothrix sp. PCC 7712]UYD33556.1 DUF4114 domain-containing protein [Tolypothrix sp. PCC 7601]
MIINGTANPDELFGNINDQVFGLEGNDTLDAEAGQGSNTLDGGPGNDKLYGNTKDTLKGGAGKDSLYAVGIGGSNSLDGGDDNDELFIVEGNNNTLEGALGDDQLWIIEGSLNFLRGGDGNDSLYAGKKGGKFTGGAGNDIFDLTSQGVPDVPVEVLDFTKGEDKIQITTIPEVKSFQDLKIEQILVNGQPGPDTVIRATINGALKDLGILRNVQANTLTADDFDLSVAIFSITNASAGEGNAIAFTVTRFAGAQLEQSVTVSTSKKTGDTASDTDFKAKTETLTFKTGETQKTFTVETIQDSLVEKDETFTVTLSNPTNQAIVSSTQGTAQGTIIDDDKKSLECTTDGDVFTIRGESDKARLKVNLTGYNSKSVNELGVFVVDDTQGRINGIAPGAAGYAEAALARAKVIFSAIANRPNGFNINSIKSLLEFSSGENIRFYLVKNGTIDGVKNGKNSIADILFSGSTTQKITDLGSNSFSLAWQDGSGSSTTSFQDLIVQIQTTNESLSLGTSQQSQSQGECIDLRSVTQQVKASFELHREAKFNNYIGFFKAVDEKGGIDTNGDGKADLLPGQTGYTQAAIGGRVGGIDLTVDNQGTATFNGSFQGGSVFVPFIIVDGKIDAFLDNNANNDPAIYFPFLGANSDKVDHIRLLGNNTFGFEDLANGGDMDYNDVIVKVDLTIA